MSVNKYDATHDLLVQIAGSGGEGSFHRTSPVQALAGATSVTITDNRIHTTSLINPHADNGTNEPIAWKTMTLSEGSCVITFDALEYDTDFELVVLADSLTEDAYITDLKDVNISSVSNGQVLAYNGTTQKWVNIDLPSSGFVPQLKVSADANDIVTATMGQQVYTLTETSSGIYECDLDEYGTYTIVGKISGISKSVVLKVDTVKMYEVELVPDGKTIKPTNYVPTWLECAGILDKQYTTLTEVLQDSTTLLALISNNNASDYLVRSTAWRNDIAANATAMTDIGANDYCAEILLDDELWCTAICGSTYYESVLNVKVPTMTGDTTPSGTCIASGTYSGFPPFKAFDSNSSTLWHSSNNTYSPWVGYTFTSPTKVKYFTFATPHNSARRPHTVTLMGSNDGGLTWVDIVATTSISTTTDAMNYKIAWENTSEFTTYAVKYSLSNSQDGYTDIHTVQFWGR